MKLQQWTAIGMFAVAIAVLIRPEAGVSGALASALGVAPLVVGVSIMALFASAAAVLVFVPLTGSQYGYMLFPMYLYAVTALFVGLTSPTGTPVPAVMYAWLAMVLRVLADREARA
jgi:hypothetical protein